ncbi:MAG: Hsp70 family protein, partial [Verrucomicrobiota bacterium]
MARVFISYRRTDCKWAVGRIYDRLSEVIDPVNLFLDVRDIEPGEDFVEKIERIVGSCDVLLVVIGPNWLTTSDRAGNRRLDDPHDFVRVEIVSALERGIRVIPLLIDDTEMPYASSLPENLQPLCRRNAKPITFSHFHADLDSLLRILSKVLSSLDERSDAISESKEQAPPASEQADLPLTISLETQGGIATPLIDQGTSLPAEGSEIFSTAEDNHSMVEMNLCWGERELCQDNVPLGNFRLEGIAPALKGVPQIELRVEVDRNLLMTVTAKDKDSGKVSVLDAVDLTRMEVPEAMKAETRATTSERDPGNAFQNMFGGEKGEAGFGSMFDDLFGSAFRAKTEGGDVYVPLQITAEEARQGGEKEVEFVVTEPGAEAMNRKVRVQIPAGRL